MDAAPTISTLQRGRLFWLVVVLVGLPRAEAAFGAIRWDCWNGRTRDVISSTVAQVLAPEKYHWRLPWYANISSGPNGSSISFDADEQSVMDEEIRLASDAGLSFFAYDTYCIWPSDAEVPQCQGYWARDPSGIGPTSLGYKPRDPAYGLKLHRQSKLKHLLNFSLILLGAAPATPQLRPRYLGLLKDPSFQRTRSGRPLVFLFQAQDAEAAMNGGWRAWAAQWAAFRNESVAQGTGNPFFVYMVASQHPRQAARNRKWLGFDAISAYALPGGSVTGVPFRNLATAARTFWADALSMQEPLVPPVPTGWDPRPRADHPPVWVHEGPEHYVDPSPEELTTLFEDARRLLEGEHRLVAEADAAIAYAWNENSEGGWVLPTKGEGDARLKALASALRRPTSPNPPGEASRVLV